MNIDGARRIIGAVLAAAIVRHGPKAAFGVIGERESPWRSAAAHASA
jgi:hypothetical protein